MTRLLVLLVLLVTLKMYLRTTECTERFLLIKKTFIHRISQCSITENGGKLINPQ